MATLKACEAALASLADQLHELPPDVRRHYVPDRSVSLTITDLDARFAGHLDTDGLHDLRPVSAEQARDAQVRFSAGSDEVVAICERPAAFMGAWVRGRVSVSAGWRDLLELRRALF